MGRRGGGKRVSESAACTEEYAALSSKYHCHFHTNGPCAPGTIIQLEDLRHAPLLRPSHIPLQIPLLIPYKCSLCTGTIIQLEDLRRVAETDEAAATSAADKAERAVAAARALR